MAFHNDLGKKGEEKAVLFLEGKGYTILEKNWTFNKLEIDIIAQKEALLVIVEVKTRTSLDFGKPEEFISTKKIQKILRTTNVYVDKNNLNENIRFDIISIYKEKGKFKIKHIKNAFYYF